MKELDFSDKIRAEFPQLLDSEAELTKEQKTLPPKLQEMILKKKGKNPKDDDKKDKESEEPKDEDKKEEKKEKDSKAQKKK
tara:strand:+ start:182 stop:424 length:243 start_codon:yes stop_codon:yes gene_type:complete